MMNILGLLRSRRYFKKLKNAGPRTSKYYDRTEFIYRREDTRAPGGNCFTKQALDHRPPEDSNSENHPREIRYHEQLFSNARLSGLTKSR